MNYEILPGNSDFFGNFQFNNRNRKRRHYAWKKTSRWHEYKEVPKPQKKWIQRPGADSSFATATVTHYRPFPHLPQSQANASSFGTVNPPYIQPFTTGRHFNLTVTIPNFSGVRSSNVFRFHNTSAKSVQFKSAPADMFPQSSSRCTESKSIKENLLKSSETGMDGDVQYLYTVQAKGDELVKVVDLSEDSDYPGHADESRIPDHRLSSDVIESGNNRKVLKIPEKETIPSSVKQAAALGAGRKRKKSTEDLHCDICESEYEFVRSRGEEIFRARCGHMFCQLCLKELHPYKCPECDIFLHKLLKVFF